MSTAASPEIARSRDQIIGSVAADEE